MRSAALGAVRRDHPKRIIEIGLVPSHASGLAAADCGQEQEAYEWAAGISALDVVADLPLGRPPEQRDLGVGQHALTRGHGTDELARLDELAGIARDVAQLARDAEAIDARCERERLGRHVGAGLL